MSAERTPDGWLVCDRDGRRLAVCMTAQSARSYADRVVGRSTISPLYALKPGEQISGTSPHGEPS